MERQVLLTSNNDLTESLEALRSSGVHTDTKLVGDNGEVVKAHWALLARHPWWSNLRQQGDDMGDGVVVLLPDRSHLELMEWVREAYRGESGEKLENLDTVKLEEFSDFKEELEDVEETFDDTNFDDTFTNDDYHEDDEEIKTERAVDEGKALQKIFQSEAISSAVATTLNNLIREGQYNVLNITKKCFEQIDNSKMVDRAFLEGFVIEDELLLRTVRGRCRRKGETLFNCKECDFSSSLRNAMEKHVIDHLGKLPFKCDLCKENFGRRDNAVKHIRMRHIFGELKSYVKKQIPAQRECHICGDKLASRQSHDDHMMRLHNDSLSNCKYCEFSSPHYRDIISHQRRVHGTEARSCHIRGSHFISQSGYNHHMKNSHGDTTYACVECGKEYKTKKTLEFHFKCNHLPKTHICETCGAKFPTETLLGSHRSSHQTDPKDFEYSCTICQRRFKSKKNLLNHFGTHSDAKPFVCDGCEMAFKSKSALKRHKSVVHDGIKPHACTICSFKAGQSHSLTVHYRGVHGLEKDVKERKTIKLQDT